MAKRKLKSAQWPNFTPHEQRTFELFHQRFGTLTAIDRETFDREWRRVEGASWDRCPECGTYWHPEKWPVCGFCKFRDRGVEYEY